MSETNGLSGFGTVLSRGDETGASYLPIGEIQKVSGGGVEVDMYESGHMQSPDGFEEVVAGMAKRSPLVVELNFVPDDTMQDLLMDDAETVPQLKRYWKVQYPPSAAPTGTYTFQGYVKKFDPAAPYRGKMTATLTIELSGKGSRS